MLQIAKQNTFNVIAAGLALAVAVVAAPAQDTSGKSALLEAVEAARDLKSLRAEVELSGSGGGLLASAIPSGKGTITLVRQAEPVEGRAWHSLVDTSYRNTQKDDETRLVALRTPTSFVWIDHEKKVVQERRHNERRAYESSRAELFALPELTGEEPFSRELREATSWKKHGREKVNGVMCDVVEVRYDMSQSADKPRGHSLIRTPASKWYFGVDDHLPRRVERITDEGMLAFSMVLDVRGVKADAEIEPASLTIKTPEGYTRTQPAKQISAEERNKALQEEINEARKNEKPPAHPPELPAHGFELVDGDGNAVSLESLKGNVAVLYFWGTWCVPCKNFSPLVSDLVETFEGEKVKVFGLPVRERDEQAVRDAMRGHKHTLLLNPGGEPIGCDATARAYKVRRYPTIYVVGFDSEVLAVKWPESGVEPADTMGQIAETIRDYLDKQN